MKPISLAILAALIMILSAAHEEDADTKTLRVSSFARHPNMVGLKSKAVDFPRSPPRAGLDMMRDKVAFSRNIGRETKMGSAGDFHLKVS